MDLVYFLFRLTIVVHLCIDKNYEQSESDDGESNLDPEEHKKSLMKLKYTDPAFYNYLQENDKQLLDFNISDDEDDDNSLINDDDNRHVPDENLQVHIFFLDIKC